MEESARSASPSGAGEAAHKGCLPGPLRPQMPVCLLPSLEVTHPPAGTTGTGVNKAVLMDVASSCWLHGRARHPALPQPCLAVPATSRRPASHLAPGPPWAHCPTRGAGTPLAEGSERRAPSPCLLQQRGPVLRLQPQDLRQGLAVLLSGAMGGASGPPGATESVGLRPGGATRPLFCSPQVGAPYVTGSPVGTGRREQGLFQEASQATACGGGRVWRDTSMGNLSRAARASLGGNLIRSRS